MDASVAICTYNRSYYLRKALNSLATQKLSEQDHFDIIVVDNNSTDATQDVVQQFESPAPVRYICEERQGLSHARNAAIQASQSELIAFIDDDAVAEADWLSELMRVYKATPAACVGGRIDLDWEIPRPDWLVEPLLLYLSHLDYGSETLLLLRQLPFGANISFRRETLDKVGGFSTTLGRKGNQLLDAEEIELCHRIRLAGGEIWYTPKARVIHTVTAQRVQREHLLRMAHGKGRSAARMGLMSQGALGTLLRAIKRGALRVPYDSVLTALLAATGQPGASFYHRCELEVDLGYVQEFLRLMAGGRNTER